MTLLLGIPTVLVLWYGGRQVMAGSLTIGGATQFILYLGMLAGFVSRLGMLASHDLPHHLGRAAYLRNTGYRVRR